MSRNSTKNSLTRVKPSPVINSRPLIALCAALADFNAVGYIVAKLIVPQEVVDELLAGGLKDDAAAVVTSTAFCEVLPYRTSILQNLASTLGAGEASVIQAALDEKLPTVIIDEVRGRRRHVLQD